MKSIQKARTNWSEELIIEHLKQITSSLDFFPTNNFLVEIGRGDLANAISRHGGWKFFSEKLKLPLTNSDTLTGWKAEDSTEKWLLSLGYKVDKQKTRSHFDFLLDNSLRIDVKGASYAEYGPSCGWFYRMGKVITSDVVICRRMDLDDYYIFPWFSVSSTNITISKAGRKHSNYYMNTTVLTELLKNRKREKEMFSF
jgi:hypothetical protein